MARPKKKILILLAAALLLIGGVAAGYFLWWQPAHSGAKGHKRDAVPPVFLKLDTFTVNLADPDADRYLQADITLKMVSQEQEDALKADIPELRNNLLLLLSSKQSEELKTITGKQALAKEIQAIGNRLLVSLGRSAGVTGVEFNTFIIQ